ncbi:hypothetical protein [Pseudoalteromonas mariniglutinosa]|uniref:hypothetical protein n=1 Tax=Pseudoalteromonas mariniglutinosa TaxID=206042 RepID=UPI00384C6D98
MLFLLKYSFKKNDCSLMESSIIELSDYLKNNRKGVAFFGTNSDPITMETTGFSLVVEARTLKKVNQFLDKNSKLNTYQISLQKIIPFRNFWGRGENTK